MESCQILQAHSKFDNPCDETLCWKQILSVNCSRLYRNVGVFDGWHVWALDVTMVKPTLRNPVNQPTNCWLRQPIDRPRNKFDSCSIYRYYVIQLICKIFGMHMRLDPQVLRDSSAPCWGPVMTRLAWLNLCWKKGGMLLVKPGSWIERFPSGLGNEGNNTCKTGSSEKNMWKRREREMKGNQGFL